VEIPYDGNCVAALYIVGDEKSGGNVLSVPVVGKCIRRVVFGETHFVEPVLGAIESGLVMPLVEELGVLDFWSFCSRPVE
jgi:hypothetical protein